MWIYWEKNIFSTHFLAKTFNLHYLDLFCVLRPVLRFTAVCQQRNNKTKVQKTRAVHFSANVFELLCIVLVFRLSDVVIIIVVVVDQLRFFFSLSLLSRDSLFNFSFNWRQSFRVFGIDQGKYASLTLLFRMGSIRVELPLLLLHFETLAVYFISRRALHLFSFSDLVFFRAILFAMSLSLSLSLLPARVSHSPNARAFVLAKCMA